LDGSKLGFSNWTFTSVQLWGELPRGKWVLSIYDDSGKWSELKLADYRLVIHGTKEAPLDYGQFVNNATYVVDQS
jgi:subtilisin-like proprotein convertase family protein